jgi:ketosteroid isomerase-like protein
MGHPRDEVEGAVRRYLALREACSAGERPWSALAECFTDDMVFVDPAWGRVEGLDSVRRELLEAAMVGLEGWEYPTDLILVEGDDVVVKWRQRIPGADGRSYEQSGYSHLVYAGEGRFRFEEDLLNMAHVVEDMQRSGWRPPPGVRMHLPPESPDRDFSVPEG